MFGALNPKSNARRALRTCCFACIALTIALGLAACGSDTTGQQSISATARAYLTRALDLLQANSIDTGKVDWPRARARAFAEAGHAQDASGTYQAIDNVIAELGNPHTRLVGASEASQQADGAGADYGPPTGHALPQRIAMVTMPQFSGDQKAAQSYVSRGAQALKDQDATDPCGWIVDLRPDSGGDMWPMLTVLAPLLTPGQVGSFVSPTGQRTPWTLRDGAAFDGKDQPVPASNTYTLKHADPPIAVLTGTQTGSSGEATLVAFTGQNGVRTFGQQTAGFPSANQGFTLSDGAALLITVAKLSDRTGYVYPPHTPIQPEVPTPPAKAGTDSTDPSDKTVAAAQDWLTKQSACMRR